MKKLIFTLSPFAFVGSALAEETGAITIGSDAASVASAVQQWAAGLAPTILPLVGAFLAFWAIKVGIRIIKGISSSAK